MITRNVEEPPPSFWITLLIVGVVVGAFTAYFLHP